MNTGVLFMLSCSALIVGVFFSIERDHRVSVNSLVLIAVLGTIAGIARVPLAGIPSVQPVTFTVICAGMALGARAGMLVGVLAALTSNTILGHGPWTIVQMFAWGMIGLGSGYLARVRLPGLIVWGVLSAFLFGWVTDLWFWLAFAYPLSLSTLLASLLSSAWFDGVHALTNAALLMLGGKDMLRLLRRYNRLERSEDLIEEWHPVARGN